MVLMVSKADIIIYDSCQSLQTKFIQQKSNISFLSSIAKFYKCYIQGFVCVWLFYSL